MIEALRALRFDPNMPLELLNGCGMVVEVIFLVWMAKYILVEARFRHLTWRHWVSGDLPYSVNFVVAVFFFDAGVCLRSIAIWVWRRFFDAGDFGVGQIAMLALGGVLIVFGGLCKLRAVTNPDFSGTWPYRPWIRAAFVVVLFALGSIVFR